MKGVNYVTDAHNKKVAVQIDLRRHGRIWEEFLDYLIATSRKDEPKIPLNKVIADLKKQGRLNEII